MSELTEDSVISGVGFAIAMHFLQIIVVPLVSILGELVSQWQTPHHEDLGLSGFVFALYGWSLTQFLYLGPAAWLAWRKGKRLRARGILLIAGLGVLLNGACDALMFRH